MMTPLSATRQSVVTVVVVDVVVFPLHGEHAATAACVQEGGSDTKTQGKVDDIVWQYNHGSSELRER